MPLNLIRDAWIPVRATDGTRRLMAPWQMADPDLACPDWPRADLTIACYELLIGLIFLADPPEDADDWEDRQAPDPDRLRRRLAPFADAFNLTGGGPTFLQDLDLHDGAANPPDMLFIDSAGDNTARNNADLMVRRARYGSLDLPVAAMALYAFQAHAPSGGAGNRTSMRGGGPLVTLVDPGEGLWPLLWANVPDGTPATPEVLPWMRPTATSKDGAAVRPEQSHPAEAFFGMPRRLRLVVEDRRVTGVIQRPWGTNYAGWTHPLTPYYRVKPESERLPVHPKAGTFGYRNWLGVVVENDKGGLREQAAVVRMRHDRHLRGELIVAGWAMDNMKPRDFILSRALLLNLEEDRADLVRGMVKAADQIAAALRHALAPVLAEGEAREAVREEFYRRTQSAFEVLIGRLSDGSADTVAPDWLAEMRANALDGLFNTHALPGLHQRDIKQQRAITNAHGDLYATLAGRTKAGVKAWTALRLDPTTVPKERRQRAMTDDDPGKAILGWWAREIGDRSASRARAQAARLSRAEALEVITEPCVHALSRQINLRDPARLVPLVQVLAHVRTHGPSSLARRLGAGDTAPLSPARFQRLIRADETELVDQLRRALRMVNRECNVARLGGDLIRWDEETTRTRWSFDYFGQVAPGTVPDAEATPELPQE